MADGEVSVSVRAEGVEDAAGEMDPDAAAATRGGGGGDDPLAATAANTTRMVKLLAVLGAIFAVFNDVLEIFATVSAILQAFVAPLAVILMRLFQPVLRILLELLPAWMSFIDENEGQFATLLAGLMPWLVLIPSIVDAVRGLWETLKATPDRIGGFIDGVRDRLGDVASAIRSLPSRIWSFMERLPALIGSAVADRLPDLPGTGGARRTTQRAADRVDEATGGRLSDARDTIINIGGGLTPFIDSITQNGSIDFP